MKLFKKGMEKPIEIFVALFVILAVALLILNLFEDQLDTQTEQLDDIGPDRQEELLTAAEDYCTNDRRCPSQGQYCDNEYLARLCISYGTDSDDFNPGEYLELDSDGSMGMDTTQVPGVGVCEDNVPCHSLVTECCGQRITAENCKDILEQHANRQGLDAEEFISNSVREPSQECKADPDFSAEMHWLNRANYTEEYGISVE